MAETNQIGGVGPGLSSGRRDCLRYEVMLVDAMDGVLSAEDQADFDQHLLTCESCAAMLADARRGEAWLTMLREDPPAPSNTLLERILAETSGRAAAEAAASARAEREALEASSLLGRPSVTAPSISRASGRGEVLSFPGRLQARLRPALNTVFQTRFAMTAAMAFFSVALTLNLVGVHVTSLRPRDLRPANLRRSFYEANAHVVRYYENLRVVYELESRVRDLQHGSDADTAAPSRDPEPAATPGNQPPPPDGAPASKPGGDATSTHPRSSTDGTDQSRQSRSGSEAGSHHLETPSSQPKLARHPTSTWGEPAAILPASLKGVGRSEQIGGLA